MNKKTPILTLIISLVFLAALTPGMVHAAADFTISATTPNGVPDTASATTTITVTPVGGFTGPVTLNDTSTIHPFPQGLSCGTITPSTVVLTTSPQTATLSCSSTSSGIYQLTINGVSGAISHFTTILITVIGTVCVAQPIVDTKCPSAAPTFNGPVTSPGKTRIRISLLLNDSTPMNGFDITIISSNATVLAPLDIDTTGTVVPGALTILLECIGTKRVLGSTCPSTSTAGTIDLAVVGAAGVTGSHTTGLLFTAIFAIVGQNPAGKPVTIGFQTGCPTPTSLGGSDSTCVTISNGTPSPPPEAIQLGSFDNSVPPSNGIQSITSTISPVGLGPFLAGTTNNVPKAGNVTITSQAGFEIFFPQVTLKPPSITAPLGVTTKPSVTLNPTTVDFSTATGPAKLNSTITVLVSTSVPGATFNVTVIGEYQVQDATTGSVDLLDTPVTFNITVVDYKLSLSSTVASVTAKQATTTTATVSLQNINGFANPVTLKKKLPANSAGLNATLSPTTISGTQTSILTITTNATLVAGNYAVIVNGTTTLGGKTKFVLVTFTLIVVSPVHNVGIVSTTPPPSPRSGANAGNQVTFTVTLQNQGPQAENGTLTIYADNIAVAYQNFTISANNPGQNVTLVWDTTGYAAKTYNVTAQITITASSNTGTSTFSYGDYTLNSSQGTSNQTLEYIAIGILAVIAAVAVIVYILRRRSAANVDTTSTNITPKA